MNGFFGQLRWLHCLALVFISTGCGGHRRYAIGGTVTGLRGTLVLQNNGIDNLTITADGVFVFGTELENKNPYDVSIASRPSNQNCTLQNGTGEISGEDISDISVSCTNKMWTYPETLEHNVSPNGEGAALPQIAMADNGDALIVWQQRDGFRDQIFKSEYRNHTWINPAGLMDNLSVDTYPATKAQVAMDKEGHAVVVWQQSDGVSDQIYKSEYRDGRWTNPSSLMENISLPGVPAANPQVAMSDNGDAIIVWHQSNGGIKQIFKSEYRSGRWTYPSSVADRVNPANQDALNPQVAMDSMGNAVIAWEQLDGTYYHIYKSEFRDGAWTYPTDLDDHVSPAGGTATGAHVAIADNGDAIIVWQQFDGGSTQAFKSERRNGVWIKPADIGDNLSPDGQSAVRVKVAMADNGDATVVWQQKDGTWEQVFKSEFRNGAWSYPADLTDTVSLEGSNATFPGVAMDNSGNIIIPWAQASSGLDLVYKSEYRNGVWTYPTDFSDTVCLPDFQASLANVAMDNTGDAIIVWAQSNGVNPQIFKSEYR